MSVDRVAKGRERERKARARNREEESRRERERETERKPPDPMNHVKKFKGWPLQDAPPKLVQLWYKPFPQGRFLPGGNEEAICFEL